MIFVDFVVGKLVIAARSHQQHELVIKSGLYEAAARLLLASIRVFLLIFSFTQFELSSLGSGRFLTNFIKTVFYS